MSDPALPRESDPVRGLLAYLWEATGKKPGVRVRDLFADDDPIVADVLAAIHSRPGEEGGWEAYKDAFPAGANIVESPARPVEEGAVTMTNDEMRDLLAATRQEGIDYARTRASRPVEVDPERLADIIADVLPVPTMLDVDFAETTARAILAALSSPEPRKP